MYEHAGSTEAGPFGYPCARGGGLHIDEAEFACEILAPPGERGELLVTPLGRTGFPVLRYRTGDVVLNTDERCPAGHDDRWLPGGIVGRTDDMVVIRGMNVYPSAIEEAVRGVTGGEFRITFYTEAGRMDEVKLEVELDDGSSARRLQDVMRHQLGLRIRIVPVARGRAAAQREQVAPRRRPAGAGLVVKIRGASEQVAAALQHRIQDAGLGPGDFLGREEDLAAEFGVSRPTLREALKLLASGNLIRANKGPGGGIFVAHTADQGVRRSLSDSVDMMIETGAVSLEELLDARMLLEVPVAGLAALQASEETIDRLRAALAAETEAGPDMDAIHAADTEFHREIAAAAGNRIAQALTGWVIEVLQPRLMAELRDAVVPEAVLDQHTALLKAIEKGDRTRAERAMREHLLYLRDVLAMTRER